MLFAPEFVFGCPRDGDKANRSRAIFEHQSYLSVVHDSACEVAVGFRYASLHGGLVIAGELALFHPGDTDESDHASASSNTSPVPIESAITAESFP